MQCKNQCRLWYGLYESTSPAKVMCNLCVLEQWTKMWFNFKMTWNENRRRKEQVIWRRVKRVVAFKANFILLIPLGGISDIQTSEKNNLFSWNFQSPWTRFFIKLNLSITPVVICLSFRTFRIFCTKKAIKCSRLKFRKYQKVTSNFCNSSRLTQICYPALWYFYLSHSKR